MSKHLRVLIVCGGPSSEHNVSLHTGEMVFRHLDRKKYKPFRMVIGKDGMWRFEGSAKPLHPGDALKRLKRDCDIVFIAMHGAFGEDGRMQALLESIKIPYTGSKVASSAMAMDKETANRLYAANGMRVPRFAILDESTKECPISFPVVIKPANGGSSVGVSVVKTKQEFVKALAGALKEDDRALVQKYIPGREFTCGVLEGADSKPFSLPPTEIIPKASPFFNYKAKYKIGGSLEITPARLAQKKIKELQKLALQAHRILGCRGMSRSDFILKGKTFYILETNTIPGMTRTSLLPQAARVAGIEFPQLLDLIIAAGLRD